MEEGSSSSSSATSIISHGGSSPAIDRHNPIIRDSTRSAKLLLRPPISLKALKAKEKNEEEKTEHEDLPVKSDDIFLAENLDYAMIEKATTEDGRDDKAPTFERRTWSSIESCNFISPPVSPRYSLKEMDVFTSPVSNLKDVKTDELTDEKQASSYPSLEQMVVVRVSLHCRGCEKKIRKHLSKMEGVSSFNIDFAAKKVSITGYITPLSVLVSMSKVKNVHLSIQDISTKDWPDASAGKGTCE